MLMRSEQVPDPAGKRQCLQVAVNSKRILTLFVSAAPRRDGIATPFQYNPQSPYWAFAASMQQTVYLIDFI